ncbi:MAG: hypothetical protein AAGK14_08860 [Verrucomicrobiota bacterium]
MLSISANLQFGASLLAAEASKGASKRGHLSIAKENRVKMNRFGAKSVPKRELHILFLVSI